MRSRIRAKFRARRHQREALVLRLVVGVGFGAEWDFGEVMRGGGYGVIGLGVGCKESATLGNVVVVDEHAGLVVRYHGVDVEEMSGAVVDSHPLGERAGLDVHDVQ